ncbi:MAG: glycosyltransferase family 2 protein [Ferribacterium limneticum]
MDKQFAPVSVVIPCFRCATTIRRAVDSVVNQTQVPSEIILVDDASDDDTWDVLSKIAEEYPCLVRLHRLGENKGAASARNAGWDLAIHLYVAFLDADDTWHPKKIEMQYTWMNAHPAVGLTGHQNVVAGTSDPVLSLSTKLLIRPIRRMRLLLSNPLPTPSVMLRREEVLLRFCPEKRYAEDYLLWLNVVFSGHKVYKLELPLSYSHKPYFGDSGLSRDLWRMEKGELDTYRRIYAAGYISRLAYWIVQCLSFAKYMRRLLVMRFRSWD